MFVRVRMYVDNMYQFMQYNLKQVTWMEYWQTTRGNSKKSTPKEMSQLCI